MSIRNQASIVTLARRDGMRDAAAIIDREIDRIMRAAYRHHDESDYERYEELEGLATLLSSMAIRIRRAASRKPRSALSQSKEG